jgi:uncharacterized protein
LIRYWCREPGGGKKDMAMSQAAKAQEPSMEEILASIRRIIADDDATRAQDKVAEPVKSEAAPPASPREIPTPPATEEAPALQQSDIDAVMARPDAPADDAKPPSDVFDLTESMATAAPVPPPEAPAPDTAFHAVDSEPHIVFDERPQQPPAEPEPAIVRAVEEARRQAVLSNSERALLSSNTSAAVDSAFNTLAHTVLVQNARTLEDLVREMLRPMLKAWLDDNLPGLVERLVRAEIERVSRGR